MLDLEQIRKFFPDYVQDKPESMVREYLQCKILELVYRSPIANKLVFIGGTALRLIYNTQRFSEDIDFDNKHLTMDEWIELGETIKRGLNLEGLNIDITKTRLNATVFHHNLRFLDILFQFSISAHKNSVLLIKADSENQGIKYESEIARLNRFDVDCKIKTMPIDIALSQKFRAFFDREMGRDLFDISSIAPKTKPNYAYLDACLGINCPKQLRDRVLARCKEMDITNLEKRAQPFLFKDTDISRIRHFTDYMRQYEF